MRASYFPRLTWPRSNWLCFAFRLCLSLATDHSPLATAPKAPNWLCFLCATRVLGPEMRKLALFDVLGHWDFLFVSGFDIRISCFPVPPGLGQLGMFGAFAPAILPGIGFVSHFALLWPLTTGPACRAQLALFVRIHFPIPARHRAHWGDLPHRFGFVCSNRPAQSRYRYARGFAAPPHRHPSCLPTESRPKPGPKCHDPISLSYVL